MPRRRTIIIKNFPGGYGAAIAFPTIKTTMGMGDYGLDIEGEWWEISHEVWQCNWDYPSNSHGKSDQAAWVKIKEYLSSKGCDEVFGWRGTLWKESGRALLNACHGMDKDNHTECVREFGSSEVIDFNSYEEKDND